MRRSPPPESERRRAEALKVPRSLVEFILLGPEDDRRQLQDSPILGDVWIEYAKDPSARLELPVKLLFPRGLGMAPKGFNVMVDGVQYFDPHDQGMGSKLTCAPIQLATCCIFAISFGPTWPSATMICSMIGISAFLRSGGSTLAT